MFHRMMNYGELEAKPTVAITRDIIKKNLPKYKRHDDLIVVQEAAWEEFKKRMPLPVTQDENSPFSIDEDELASLVCQTVQKPLCKRLAVEKRVQNDDYRTPNVELVLGDTGLVKYKENEIIYQFDVTKCMFSMGNIHEKMRMASLDCSEEIVVDLFAGIGYFSLPLLIHAQAKHLYACEWNPDAIEAFKSSLLLNKIEPSRCTVIEGDNRSNRPTDVAQRVILGILPSSLEWMQTAFECIDKTTGAILHCHCLVGTKPPISENLLSGSPASEPESIDLTGKDITGSESQLNQSNSSSSSSQSTIEKLSASSDPPNESDPDTSSSPVLLDVSPEPGANTSSATTDSSSGSSQNEESIQDPPQINDHEMSVYELKAQALIARIKEDVEDHDLKISLMHIQPVKSYAPHVNHVVFDIKIEPKSPQIISELPEATNSPTS